MISIAIYFKSYNLVKFKMLFIYINYLFFLYILKFKDNPLYMHTSKFIIFHMQFIWFYYKFSKFYSDVINLRWKFSLETPQSRLKKISVNTFKIKMIRIFSKKHLILSKLLIKWDLFKRLVDLLIKESNKNTFKNLRVIHRSSIGKM